MLSVKNLTFADKHASKPALSGVSFDVREGEIVTIAGIGGNGQDELVDVITGNVKATSGSIFMNGEDITGASIRRRNDLGIGLIPVDRLRDAIIGNFNMTENMILKRYYEPEFSPKGILDTKHSEEYAERLMEEYDVRTLAGTE